VDGGTDAMTVFWAFDLGGLAWVERLRWPKLPCDALTRFVLLGPGARERLARNMGDLAGSLKRRAFENGSPFA